MFIKKHSSKKRRAKENLHPFLDVEKSLVTEDEEKTEVVNDFLALVFNSRTSSSLVLRFCSWKTGMGSIMKPLQSKSKWSVTCYTTENMKSIYKKGQKEDSEKYRPVSLTSETGKALEQVMFSITTKHVRGWGCQWGFKKGRSCLTNLISFCDRMTCFVNEGKAVDMSTWT